MKTGRTRYIILLFFLLYTGCEKDVNNVKLPEFESKLVVTSFISPSDSISYITVEPNQRIYGDLSIANKTGNITGYISDGVTEVKLDTTGNGFKFSSSTMKIDYGKSYSIRIESDKGLKAEGKCTVPVMTDFNLRVDTFSIYHEEPGYLSWREMKAKVTFTDPDETENYYRTIGTCVTYYTYSNSTKPRINAEYIWFEEDLLTDAVKDENGDIINVADFNPSYSFSDSAYLNITLLNTEKTYYQYHKSLEYYSDGDNPFSEPTPVFTNIEGGPGIFTSYTKETVTLRLK